MIEKTKADCQITETTLSTRLTQEETLKFSEREILIQIRARFPDGEAIECDKIPTTAEEALKDGVI